MDADYWDAHWIDRRGAINGPEVPFCTFLGNRPFGRDSFFLDIGCGRGGASRLLEDVGVNLIALDISKEVRAHVHCDIREYDCEDSKFDCIVDLKTLCCLEDPPYNKIYKWLKPGGWLYSMYPTSKHASGDPHAWDVKADRDYCRCPTADEMRHLMKNYPNVMIREYFQPIGPSSFVSSWCVEAQK